jgi:hypothetical protein
LDIKKVIVSGTAAGFVALVISMVLSFAFQALFDYDIMSLPGMRSVNDPVSILFFLHPFVLALAMAALYDCTKKAFAGTVLRKGLTLGLLTWMVYGIPSAFIVFSSMTYPLGFTMNSVFGTLACTIGAGITIAKLHK